MAFAQLPTDFKNWSWNESNGSASKEQTHKAYKAVLNKSAVMNFSYLVWNDMVDLLHQAVTQSNFSWDETFGSYENTRMKNSKSILTAKMFNAVRKNISIFYNDWSWAIDKNADGYIGRLDFYGYSDVYDDADLIFGSYFLELAEKLVVLIEILKNEVIFTDLKILQAIIFLTDAIINAYQGLDFYTSIDEKFICDNTTLSLEQVLSASINCYLKAIIYTNMTEHIIGDLKADGLIFANYNATMYSSYGSFTSAIVNNKINYKSFIAAMASKDNSYRENLKLNNSADLDFGRSRNPRSTIYSKFSITSSSVDKGLAQNLTTPVKEDVILSFANKCSLLTGIPVYASIEESIFLNEFGLEANLDKTMSQNMGNIFTSIIFDSKGILFIPDRIEFESENFLNIKHNTHLDKVLYKKTYSLSNASFNSIVAVKLWEQATMKKNGLHIKQIYSTNLENNILEVR